MTTVVKEVQARLQVSHISIFSHKIPTHHLTGTPRDPSSSVKTATASEGGEGKQQRIPREGWEDWEAKASEVRGGDETKVQSALPLWVGLAKIS